MKVVVLLIQLSIVASAAQVSVTRQASDQAARERSRNAVQQQFKDNFRELQLRGIALLKAHEAGTLVASQLSRDVKAIQRRARSLKGLLVLGDPNPPSHKLDEEIQSAVQFDRSIRLLSKLVSDFAHNPIHKNTKIFDTDQAAQAASDLLAIIDLSKVIERRARNYSRS